MQRADTSSRGLITRGAGSGRHQSAAPSPQGVNPTARRCASPTVAWFAASCNPGARALAARWWPMLHQPDRARALALSPDGAILNPAPAALPLVAVAAAAKAAGNSPAAQQLLRQAGAQQHNHPTYYGGAWTALGTALLTTKSLSSC